MFCVTCGAEAVANANFCIQCGKPLASEAVASEEAYFFTASTKKLVLLSVFTFGMYKLYWFYKNWRVIREQTGKKIMPFWRTVFCYFWAYSCFKQIKIAAKEQHIQTTLPIGYLAAAFIVLDLCGNLWNLPNPYAVLGIIGSAAVACLVPVNTLAIRVNERLSPRFQNNDRLTGWNWLALIVGGIILIMAILACFLLQDGGSV